MLLSRNELLTLTRKMERVAIPEAGHDAEILVAEMNGQDREVYEQWAIAHSKQVAEANGQEGLPPDLYAKMTVLCCVDEEGERLFQLTDVALVTKKPYAMLKRIFDVAWRLNHLSDDFVEEAEKNSVSEQA